MRRPYKVRKALKQGGYVTQLWTRRMWELKTSERITGQAVVVKDGWRIVEEYNRKTVAAPPEAIKAEKKTESGIDLLEVENAIKVGDTDDLSADALIELVSHKKWQITNYRKLPRTELLKAIQGRILDDADLEAQEVKETVPAKKTRKKRATKKATETTKA